MATMYGEGATYDAIEGRFRHIRRQAAQMVEEVNSGARPAAPARGNGNASTNSTANNSFAAEGDGGTLPTTPKKSKGTKTPGSTPRGGKKNVQGEKVLTGRVNKNQTNASASAKASGKNGVNRFKEEVVIDPEDVSGLYETMEVDAEGVAESLGLVGGFGEYGGLEI
ncbi:MAG: hypothetical protein LQ342_006309 [Letrouitia transgressa]|nr:MAG: hypothetical protein LQ342_006309 [Letrouitia transgressa]